MRRQIVTFAGVLPVLGLATPVIDDSPTRVQTTLKVDMTCVGTLRPKGVGEISTKRWTVDCAGIDREHADWRSVCEYVPPLGIARIRQQAGWARCEKDPGIYDFAWLDYVVFDAKKRGIDVWMELTYGNPSYPGGGGRGLAAGIPTSEEGLAAWDRWVERMVDRYKGTVKDWCVWNEPDNDQAPNDPQLLARFAIRTAKIIRRGIPDAHIDAYALCWPRMNYIEPFVEELLRTEGGRTLFNTLTYHHYWPNPDGEGPNDNVKRARAYLDKNLPELGMKEGEGGTLSEWCAHGALNKMPWTELKQAKYDLRRSLGDLSRDIDTSVFHLCDLEYRTSFRGFHDGLVRYGLLKSTGQADGFRVLKVKTAYYAIQNAVSVFNDALEPLAAKTTSTLSGLENGWIFDWRDRRTGLPVVVFWDGAKEPQQDNVTVEAKVAVKGARLADPVWTDLLTGDCYAIPADRISEADGTTVYTVPVYDSPAFITDRSLLTLDKSWEVRWREEKSAR